MKFHFGSKYIYIVQVVDEMLLREGKTKNRGRQETNQISNRP